MSADAFACVAFMFYNFTLSDCATMEAAWAFGWLDAFACGAVEHEARHAGTSSCTAA